MLLLRIFKLLHPLFVGVLILVIVYSVLFFVLSYFTIIFMRELVALL